ncbi:MAG: ABC transporter substrate-binding protein [Paracoccaceae bacterium]
MKLTTKISALLLASVTSLGLAQAEEMGAVDEPIKLAINEWTGQHISTHVAGKILESMGYKVEYVTAGNYPQHTALADGDLSASLEVWTNNAGEIYPKMIDAGKTVNIGDLGLKTREGWVYPKHMEEICPGLPDWKALEACKDKLVTAETFPQGRLLDYPADWGTRSVGIIAALGLDYKAVPAGSEGALVAELKSSVAQKTPLVMMFWAPHWVFAEVDVGWVDLPAYDPACDTDPAWGPNPNATGDCGVEQPKTMKVAWAGFQEKWPAAYKLLEEFQMNTADQEKMMKAIDQDGEKLDDVIAAYVDANKDTWTPWVEAAKQ